MSKRWRLEPGQGCDPPFLKFQSRRLSRRVEFLSLSARSLTSNAAVRSSNPSTDRRQIFAALFGDINPRRYPTTDEDSVKCLSMLLSNLCNKCFMRPYPYRGVPTSYLTRRCSYHSCNKNSAVDEMGDRLATIDTDLKLGPYLNLID